MNLKMENLENRQIEAAIVGGGLGGLALATYLARDGVKVALFEKASAAGGRARTFQRGDFRFNLGAHALYTYGPGESVLKELGVSYHGQAPKVSGKAIRNRRLYTLPPAVGGLIPGRLLDMQGILEIGKISLKIKQLEPQDFAHITVREWLNTNLKSKKARQFLEGFMRVSTYTNAPDYLSAEIALTMLKSFYSGYNVLYLDGGWQTLVDGLLNKARQAGAQVITGKRVDEVVRDPGKVTGLRMADGEFIPAQAVFLALPAKDAARLVDGGQNPTMKRWTENSKPAMSANLSLGLRRLPYPDRLFTLGLDAPLYYSVHSPYAKLAPEGKIMLHTAKYLEPDQHHDADANERVLEKMLDLIQPGWRDEVLAREYLPEMTVMSAIPGAPAGGFKGRPTPPVPGISGLYVAGDWVGSEGILTGTVLGSAREAARHYLQTRQVAQSGQSKMVWTH
jgi:phytoene dehydrogenase-like protein